MSHFNGLNVGMANLHLLSDAKTRSISPENFTGEKGKGGMAVTGMNERAASRLGQGWKVSPCIRIESGETFELAAIDGPGSIQHIWMTPTGHWRNSILRIYWDDQDFPSVEAPVGDFFACGWGGICTGQFSCGNGKSRKRIQLLLEHAVPQKMPDYHDQYRHRFHDPLLPD